MNTSAFLVLVYPAVSSKKKPYYLEANVEDIQHAQNSCISLTCTKHFSVKSGDDGDLMIQFDDFVVKSLVQSEQDSASESAISKQSTPPMSPVYEEAKPVLPVSPPHSPVKLRSSLERTSPIKALQPPLSPFPLSLANDPIARNEALVTLAKAEATAYTEMPIEMKYALQKQQDLLVNQNSLISQLLKQVALLTTEVHGLREKLESQETRNQQQHMTVLTTSHGSNTSLFLARTPQQPAITLVSQQELHTLPDAKPSTGDADSYYFDSNTLIDSYNSKGRIRYASNLDKCEVKTTELAAPVPIYSIDVDSSKQKQRMLPMEQDRTRQASDLRTSMDYIPSSPIKKQSNNKQRPISPPPPPSQQFDQDMPKIIYHSLSDDDDDDDKDERAHSKQSPFTTTSFSDDGSSLNFDIHFGSDDKRYLREQGLLGPSDQTFFK